MSIATDYIVRTKFVVDGNPQEKLRGVGEAAAGAGARVDSLGSQLRGLGGILGGAFVGQQAKKAFIDFNDNLEQAQLRMAGLFNLNEGGTFNDNMAKSVDLVGRLQQRAKASVGETSDFVEMAANILQPLTAAKAKMSEIEDITSGATVAARSFGIQAEVAALDIDQALRGQLQSKDRFAKALLGPMGFDAKSFNALSQQKRLETLARAFRAPALRSLAQAQATSFSGQLSTLTDNLKMGLGKVGLPLFKEITAQLGRWNAWIDQNPGRITEFARSASQALVDGFHAVQGAMEWVSQNRDVLLSLAKAAIVMKGASLAGSVIGAPLQMLGRAAESMSLAGGAAKGFAGAMTSATAKIGAAANVLGLVAAGASLAADAILRKRERDVAAHNAATDVVDYALSRQGKGAPSALQASSRVDDALAAGLLQRGPNGRLTVNERNLAYTTGRGEAYDIIKSQERFGVKWEKSTTELIVEMNLLRLATHAQYAQAELTNRGTWGLIAAAVAEQTRKTTEDLVNFQAPGKQPADIKVGTIKVEVAARDPERWLSDALDAVVKKRVRVPIRARGALRGEGGR